MMIVRYSVVNEWETEILEDTSVMVTHKYLDR